MMFRTTSIFSPKLQKMQIFFIRRNWKTFAFLGSCETDRTMFKKGRIRLEKAVQNCYRTCKKVLIQASTATEKVGGFLARAVGVVTPGVLREPLYPHLSITSLYIYQNSILEPNFSIKFWKFWSFFMKKLKLF